MAFALILCLGFGYAWRLVRVEQPATPAAMPPAISDAVLEVRFKRSAEELDYHVLDEQYVPLTTGSLLWLHVRLPAPAYPYLFFLAQGEAPTMLYPDADEVPRPVAEFYDPPVAPDPTQQVWHTLSPPAGTEMFLLLVADVPVSDLDGLRQELAALPLPQLNEDLLLAGDPANPEIRSRVLRGITPDSAVSTRALPKDLSPQWRSRFRYVRILAYPHVPPQGSQNGE